MLTCENRQKKTHGRHTHTEKMESKLRDRQTATYKRETDTNAYKWELQDTREEAYGTQCTQTEMHR